MGCGRGRPRAGFGEGAVGVGPRVEAADGAVVAAVAGFLAGAEAHGGDGDFAGEDGFSQAPEVGFDLGEEVGELGGGERVAGAFAEGSVLIERVAELAAGLGVRAVVEGRALGEVEAPGVLVGGAAGGFVFGEDFGAGAGAAGCAVEGDVEDSGGDEGRE